MKRSITASSCFGVYVVKNIIKNYDCSLKSKIDIHEAFSLLTQDKKLVGYKLVKFSRNVWSLVYFRVKAWIFFFIQEIAMQHIALMPILIETIHRHEI